eukprot:COSAG01_NODE_37949_length_496_cov_3.511335_1_plen_76_part_01
MHIAAGCGRDKKSAARRVVDGMYVAFTGKPRNWPTPRSLRRIAKDSWIAQPSRLITGELSWWKYARTTNGRGAIGR